ncbi:serine/threonine protein kinase [Actinomadura bangladeshensis]|uniref:non-specific serine/threonine protein kinase n=2 Tax=Actinomadura bangladeshensis TaxID=453573 RepID=A0A6L9QJH2_9ACTN|nr:serine/threonine protein kinase [Actinomadura bangladeshensis]
MGTVWSAVDETLHRTVAVKEIVFPDVLTSDERRVATDRAQREARAAALIDHPGVITVHDVVIEDERPWIVMELVRGASLAEVIRRDGPCPPAAAARIGLALLDALGAAHARGIVHRDVKPGNVLLAEDGRVVLTDFGIASIEADPALTRTGTFVGSPGYIAPERLREQPGGPESDLWSLGATLYTTVEGRPPFERDSPMAVLGAVLAEEPAPPRQAGHLAPLLWQLLHKVPSARPGMEDVRAGSVECVRWQTDRSPPADARPAHSRADGSTSNMDAHRGGRNHGHDRRFARGRHRHELVQRRDQEKQQADAVAVVRTGGGGTRHDTASEYAGRARPVRSAHSAAGQPLDTA